MNKLCEKIKLYKEKNKLLKEKYINDFNSLPDELVDDYIDIINKNEIMNGLKVYNALTITTHSMFLLYVILTDNELKYNILNMINTGITPVINDVVTDDLYKYFTFIIILSSLLYSKFDEMSKSVNLGKKLLEKEEPKLKGYKYLGY
ncbi:MAG: hypothetical protein IJ105_04495 [Bacilli bacterium]|nr:hypothetical protein [Bacilli bacterium]